MLVPGPDNVSPKDVDMQIPPLVSLIRPERSSARPLGDARSILLLSSIVVFILTAGLAVMVYGDYRAQRALAEYNTMRVTHLLGAHLEAHLQRLEESMEVVAERAITDPQSLPYFDDRVLKKDLMWQDLVILGWGQKHVPGEYMDSPRKRAVAEYLLQHVASDHRGLLIGPPLRHDGDRDLVVAAGCIGHHSDGTPKVIVGAPLNVNHLLSQLQVPMVREVDQIALWHATGEALAMAPGDAAESAISSLADDIRQASLGTSVQRLGGRKHLVAYDDADPWPLMVSYVVPLRLALDRWYRALVLDLGVFAVLLLAAVLGTYHGFRRFQGATAHSAVLQEEINERIRLTEALRQSEARFRNLVESVTDWFWEVDREYRYVYASPQVKEILGYAPQEVMGKTPFDLMPPEEAKRVRDLFEAHVKSGRSGGQIENTVIHADGHEVVLETSFDPRFDQEGRLIGWRGIDRDITARVQAQRAALQMSRIEATASLAGGIAHDFNNLMVGVLGYAELLSNQLPEYVRGELDPKARERELEDALEMLSIIAESAGHASELSKQMLAFAQGGTHEPEDMSLKDTVFELARLQERNLPPGVRIDLDLQPDLWLVHADPTQMSQAVLNLLTNAIEAVGEEGSIHIRLGNVSLSEVEAREYPTLQPGPHVRLEVEDDGPGMSPELRQKVFSPFFSTKELGRGLGLAAVYGITQTHAGHIAVYSEPGEGTTFEILLPAVEGNRAAVAKSPHLTVYSMETEEDRASILVVDDEAAVVNVTRRMLVRLGYRVLTAYSAQEALSIATIYQDPIDVALIDLSMPGMRAAELFRRLRATRPELLIFLSSSYDLDQEAQDLLDAGAYAFVSKPYGFTKLNDELQVALANKDGEG
jgi:PAS domain S-box-containing protein